MSIYAYWILGQGFIRAEILKMVITTRERIFVATPTIISYKWLSLWFHRIVSCYMYIKVLIPANSFYSESVVSQCFGIAQIVSFKRLRYQPAAWEMPRIQRLECEYHTLLPWWLATELIISSPHSHLYNSLIVSNYKLGERMELYRHSTASELLIK